MPSPIDPPRLLGDQPLSGWQLGTTVRVASKEAFDAVSPQAFVQARGEDASAPAMRDGEPIAVELVRGSNGPTDESWTVTVNGLRYQLEAPRVEGDPYVVTLPEGVAREVITAKTRVRSVTFSVRLEAEAKTPVSAELTVKRILDTTDNDSLKQEDIESMATQVPTPITPYRCSDLTAKALVLPYPFWAPSQSALGIVSFQPIARWQERVNLIKATNAFYSLRNTAYQAAYEYEKRLYDQYEVEKDFDKWADGTLKAGAQVLQPLYGTVVGSRPALSKEQRNALKVPKPKVPTPKSIKTQPKRPPPNVLHSQVVGGASNSAAYELTKLFEKLLKVCKDIRKQDKEAESEKAPRSLLEQLAAMRNVLSLDNETKALALLDALMSTEPYPPVTMLLDLNKNRASAKDAVFTYDERKAITSDFRNEFLVMNCAQDQDDKDAYKVKKNDPETAVPDLDPEVRARLLNDVLEAELGQQATGAKTKRVENDADYMFNYERLTLESRASTTVQLAYRVDIVEHNSSTKFSVQFQASKLDGLVAQAVYAGVRKDIDELDIVSRKFVRCMFDVYLEDRGLANQAKDVVREGLKAATRAAFGKYRKPRIDAASGYAANIWDIMKFLTYGQSRADARKWQASAPFKLDPCRLEARVFELRLMSRELLPIWPPMDITPPLAADDFAKEGGITVEPLYDGADAPAPAATPVAAPTAPVAATSSTAALLDIGAPVPPVTATGAAGFDEFLQFRNDAAKEQRAKWEAELQEVVNARIQEEQRDAIAQRLEELLAPASEPGRVYTLPPGSEKENVVTRLLPHIVMPGRHVAIRIAEYESDEPDFARLMTEDELRRYAAADWGTYAIAATAGMLAWHTSTIALYKAQGEAAQDASSAWWGKLAGSVAQMMLDPKLLPEIAVSWVTGGPIGVAAVVLANDNSRKFISRLAARGIGMFSPGVGSPQMAAQVSNEIASAPFGYNLATMTLRFFNRRKELNATRIEGFDFERKKLFGKPIKSSTMVAKRTLVAYEALNAKTLEAFGTAEPISVIYNEATGQRFRLYEYFEASAEVKNLLQTMPAVHSNETWEQVPNSLGLSVGLPRDVADAIVEVTELRGIPVRKIIEFTAGINYAHSTFTAVGELARQVHDEVMQTITNDRRLLKGEHLMKSAHDTSVQLATAASALLKAMFSSKVGSTLVRSDDLAWTCVEGGVAARLALRHMPYFQEAEALYERAAGADLPGVALQYWQKPRRKLIEAFADAWVEEAKKRVETQSAPGKQHAIGEMAAGAARAFARVKVLSDEDGQSNAVPLLTVASAAAHELFAAATPTGDVAKFAIEQVKAQERVASEFGDQDGFRAPGLKQLSRKVLDAYWASRRIAVREGNRYELAPAEGDVSVIRLLSGHDAEVGKRIYYCPLGSRIGLLPSREPFKTQELGARLVWIAALRDAARRVMLALQPSGNVFAGDENATIILAQRLDSNERALAKGVARSPLMLVVDEQTVLVPVAADPVLSSTAVQAAPPAPQEDVADLVSAIAGVERASAPAGAIAAAVAQMHVTAFNSERLLQAWGLALTSGIPGLNAEKVAVHLSGLNQTVALAIGLALSQIEVGAIEFDLVVHVPEVQDTRSRLARVMNKANAALEAGCKACTLAEAALAL